MLASNDLAREPQGDDRPDTACLARLVDRANVVALVRDAVGGSEAVAAHGVEQFGNDRSLSVPCRVLPSDGKARRGADRGVDLKP